MNGDFFFNCEVRKEIFLWRTLSDMKGRKTEKRKSKQNVNSKHLNIEIRLVACSEVTQQNNSKHRTPQFNLIVDFDILCKCNI